MRIPVRDFWTFVGFFLSSFPLIMLWEQDWQISMDILYCSGPSLLVGIPMLIIGLRMQIKHFGDYRVVKWLFVAWVVGLLLGFLFSR